MPGGHCDQAKGVMSIAMPTRATGHVLLACAALVGCAAQAQVPVVLTGHLEYRNGDPVVRAAHMLFRDSMISDPIHPLTDSTGAFSVPLVLARGCHGVTIADIGFDPIDWHVWVSDRDTLSLGTAQLHVGFNPTGEGRTYLVLDCGSQDTVKPIYNWNYDTLSVRDLSRP